ncbi:MAG: SBBP repeat-containing protein, partial [Methylococcales bacterium]
MTCLLAFGSYSAQAALKLEWAKRAGGAGFDVGNQIAVDSSGNAYVAGIVTDPATFGLGESSETTLTSNFLGAFVAKYSASGDLIWVKPSGSPRGLAVDNSGSVYVMGNFTNTVTFGSGESSETTLTSDGGNDIFLAKYTADGDLVWAKRAGGISFDVGSSLAVDGSGNAYLTGFFSSGIATFGSGEANEVTLTGNDFSDGNLFVAK